jgi:putative spermidine/putrescine transport system ATP-binding protein
MVAGFIAPTSGSIRLGGRDITGVPAHKRDAGLVFQNYALFPHLTAAENIAFGLRRRGVAKAECEQRVSAIIDKLRLTGLGGRMPAQLSGGQQQRVAVARALVINPSILLLDEPFSNLDAKLREGTGLELSRLQREFGLTSIFVTHDQSEAMNIAETIAVMKDGELQQIGSASDIYEQPANRFVAEFIGRANFLPGRVVSREAASVSIALDAGVTLSATDSAGTLRPGDRAIVLLRPEAIVLAQPGEPQTLTATVEAVSYQGAAVYVHSHLPDETHVTCSITPEASRRVRVGENIGLRPIADRLRAFAM